MKYNLFRLFQSIKKQYLLLFVVYIFFYFMFMLYMAVLPTNLSLFTILIGLPCSVGMIIYAEPILKLLFPNASSGAFIFQISAMSIIFVTIEQTVTGALQGLGKIYVPILSLLARSSIKTYNKFNICKNKSRYIYISWCSRCCFWYFSMPYSFYDN